MPRAFRWSLAGAAMLSLLALMTIAVPAGAAAGDAESYLAAVKQARAICRGAAPGDAAAAARAAAALRSGAGDGQPEVISDLDTNPPRFADAADRLLALELALEQPVAPADGARADSTLRSILSEARYQANGPSIFDRIQAWLLAQLVRLLLLATSGRGGIAQLVEFGVAVAVGVVVAVFLARSVWSRRGGGTANISARPKARHTVDWFSEADRLASAGDYAAALRALTSGVATALGGEGAWETSPLTVRELFVRSARVDPLRPLLVPFEASAYGHRQPDAAVYARAAEAAAPFRAPQATAPAGAEL